MGFQPFGKQHARSLALIAIGIQIIDMTLVILPGLTEALFTQEADGKLRQRAQIQHRLSREGTQFLRQREGVLLVGTHHADEMLTIQRTVQGNNRQRIVGPTLIERMLRRQSGGNDQRIDLTLQQMFDAAHFVIRLIFRTGNQQLVAALARLTLQIVGNPGVAGVFQIRDHQTDRSGAPGA
ncbi:hypothetical protein D3C71_1562990 [compost metagenome]